MQENKTNNNGNNSNNNDNQKIYLFDSTLRDGFQARGVDFTPNDKFEITKRLIDFGIDYIEGGFPGANPTDEFFFGNLPQEITDFGNSKIVAFGMTRRANTPASADKSLNNVIKANTGYVCLVGKSWDFHVTNALNISLEENTELVADSIKYAINCGVKEVMLDAEHFFDGFKHNKEYALKLVKTAYDAGARWVVLCDTNGGSMPNEIFTIVSEVARHIPHSHIGIHCHNDTENAVANSLEAVRAGARQVQGTIGGYGERCGNANLISLIPTLKFKLGYLLSVPDEKLQKLTKLNNSLDDLLNRPRYKHAAYVGENAFAHKGGLHISAVNKSPYAYEHIQPELIGNKRLMLISNQAGRASILNRLEAFGITTEKTDKRIDELLALIKNRELEGFAYDSAEASFELLALRMFGKLPEFFTLNNFRVITERRHNAKGELVTFSEAKVDLSIHQEKYLTIAEGDGPVQALYFAMTKALNGKYPSIRNFHLQDYKVRIIDPKKEVGAKTRVQIEGCNGNNQHKFTTIGVSSNIIDASYEALSDSFKYSLLRLV